MLLVVFIVVLVWGVGMLMTLVAAVLGLVLVLVLGGGQRIVAAVALVVSVGVPTETSIIPYNGVLLQILPPGR